MNKNQREVLKGRAFSYGPGVRRTYLTLVSSYGQKIGDNYLQLITGAHTCRQPRRKKIGGGDGE